MRELGKVPGSQLVARFMYAIGRLVRSGIENGIVHLRSQFLLSRAEAGLASAPSESDRQVAQVAVVSSPGAWLVPARSNVGPL